MKSQKEVEDLFCSFASWLWANIPECLPEFEEVNELFLALEQDVLDALEKVHRKKKPVARHLHLVK